ncbi:putative transcription factor c2h2 [Golovinomyces cichoracearum]|uniref:Putative transcription factor c2h2 n=1 Tax=Golovinomyces cichoracearum TaxID=62708 RepID=A0A420J9C8_9PEZI|nr:putative transcription factor c2h2 [Golovinomyces cichoracearum]
MSRRSQVRKSHRITDSSPVQNRRTETSNQSSEAILLRYSPPHFSLSVGAKRKIEELYLHHDFTKYKKHIKDATNLITKATYECNDRFWQRNQKFQALNERMRTSENVDEKLKIRFETENKYTQDLGKKVECITAKAEKALRDLIDFGDELSIQSNILHKVAEKAAEKEISSHTSRRQSSQNEVNSIQDENGTERPVLRGIDIFKTEKRDYKTKYESKGLKERYADHNDYKNFKGMIHDAQNQGPNARPLSDPKYWFSEDRSPNSSSQKQQENEDDEIEMTGATANLKCSFTLQYFEEPYSNKKCKHTYEKSAILDYLNTEGAVPSQGGRRGRPQGSKKITCPTPGCSVTLELEDFFLDERVKQQVIKAKRYEAANDLADDSDEDGLSEFQRSKQDTILGDDINSDGIIASVD